MTGDARFYVYILYRHDDGIPCYVGKGKGERFKGHFKYGRHYNHMLRALIERAGGILPHAIIQFGLTETEAFDLEVQLIGEIGRRAHGGPLVNMTDGGDGCSGARHSEEWKASMSARNMGRKASDEAKLKMSIAQKINCGRPEYRALMSLRNKGKVRSKEVRENLSKANKERGTVPPSRKGTVNSVESNERRAATMRAVIARKKEAALHG